MALAISSVSAQKVAAGTTTIVSDSFTPANGDWVAIPFTAFGSATYTFTVTDSIGVTGSGNSWVIVKSVSTNNLTGGIAYGKVGSGASTGTVTLTASTSMTNSVLEVLKITGSSGVGTSGVGTGSAASVTLGSAPASTSLVLGMVCIRTGAAEGTTTTPSGFTSDGMVGTTTTATWHESAYKNGSSPTTFAWTEQNLASTSRTAAVEFLLASGATTLAVNDSVNATDSDNETLTQLHVLTVGDSVHGSDSDQVTFNPNQYGYGSKPYGGDQYSETSYLEAFHEPNAINFTYSDNLDLVQTENVSVNNNQNSTASDGIVLTQTHNLFIYSSGSIGYVGVGYVGIDLLGSVEGNGDAGASHSSNSDGVTIVVLPIDLVLNSAVSFTDSDNVVITQVHNLVVASSTHTHTAAGISLTQTHVLIDTDTLNVTTSGSVALTQSQNLVVSSSQHNLVSDDLFLSASGDVVPNSTIHLLTSSLIVLIQTNNLAVQNSVQATASSSLSLLLPSNLSSQNGSNSTGSDEIVLTQDQFLVVSSASHSTDSDNVVAAFVYVMHIDNAGHSVTSTDATPSKNLVVQDANHRLTSQNFMFVYGEPKIWFDGSWTRKPVKVYRSGSWVTVQMKQWVGDSETWQLV